MSKRQDNDIRSPFNVKVLRNYVEYLTDRLDWDQDRIDELFSSIGAHSSFIESDDNWFDIDLSDRFYDAAVAATGDPDLAYKVGMYIITAASKGIPGRIAQSLLSPSVAFKNIAKLTEPYTKASAFEPVRVINGRAVIRALILNRQQDRPYICRNRQGILESVPTMFGCAKLPSVHSVCIYTGGPYCEYELSWREPFRYRPVPTAALTAAVAGLMAYASGFSALSTVEMVIASGLGVYTVLREMLVKRMKAALDDQNVALSESLDVMERRRDEQVLLKDIIKTTTAMMPIAELAQVAVAQIKSEMKYDRAVIGLIDSAHQKLKMQASVGFDESLKELLNQAEFTIRPDNNSGFFIKVINTKKPLLETQAQKAITQHSPKSQELLKLLGTQAFIAVPILFKGEVLGVLSVENVEKSKKLDTNDLELITSLADHLAVAISNAQSFEATKRALIRTQILEKEQREAKELFQKYVPTEVREGKIGEESSLAYLENKILSVMFTDIVGFTTISERRREEDVAKILSIYIEVINEIVTAAGGRINKVIGDGLLVYFDPNQQKILPVGFQILESVQEINRRLEAEGLPPIQIAAGAHRGRCTLGSIGYAKRLDYTLIGDTVNTASRIQGSTRQWGVNNLCFSANLLDEVEGFSYLSRGKISLKGKAQGIEIFELLRRTGQTKQVA
jgi:class 3 adenylate cyclase